MLDGDSKPRERRHPSRRVEMENPHFFYQQGSWYYQLAWQCFDLTVAQKLNVMGNELIAKARELQSAEHKPSPAQRDAP